MMKRTTLPLPLLGLIAGTRGMLGAGVGLLLSTRIPRRDRRKVGLALLCVGAVTTVPLLWAVGYGMKEVAAPT